MTKRLAARETGALLRCAGLVLAATVIALAGSCAAPREAEQPASNPVHHSISKDLCGKLDFARIAQRLDAQLLPLDPGTEVYEDFRVTCTHGTYGGAKSRSVSIQVTVMFFKSPEFAVSEFRSRASRASAPSDSSFGGDDATYSYMEDGSHATAGIRDENLLAEVRLRSNRRPDDTALPGLLVELTNDFVRHVLDRALRR